MQRAEGTSQLQDWNMERKDLEARRQTGELENGNAGEQVVSVDKKNQLDVTFCILYFSSNSCSTCFGQPCGHHQELTTA